MLDAYDNLETSYSGSYWAEISFDIFSGEWFLKTPNRLFISNKYIGFLGPGSRKTVCLS